MASILFLKKGEAFTLEFELEDTANPGLMKVAPTIAAGDFQVSKDGGALANMTNLPSVAPAGSSQVQAVFSATEANCDRLSLRAHDASGGEWNDFRIDFLTSPFSADELEAMLTAYTATRAGYLDKLNVSGNLAHSDAAATYKADVSALALEDTLTAIKGAGWTTETLAALDALVDAIKAKTDTLPASPAATGAQMDLVNAPNATAVTAIQNGLATGLELAAVETHGDGAWATATGFSTHDAADVWAVVERTLSANPGLDAAGIRTAIGLALANLDTQLAALATSLAMAAVKAVVDAVKLKTDTIPASPAAVGDAMTLAAGAVTDAVLAADTDVYQAQVWAFVDELNTTDRYAATWHKNGAPVLAGVTLPTIQIYAVATGVDLIAETAMTADGNGGFRYNEATNRMTAGGAYMAKLTATIDGATRTWLQPVGRDSEAA